MAARAKFEMESTPPKKTKSSRVVWVNLIALFLAILPPIREYLATLPNTEAVIALITTALTLLNIAGRFATTGPVSGTAALVGYGINKATDKAVGGLKSTLNVLPGVSFK